MELLWDIRKDPQLKYYVCDVEKYVNEHDVSNFFGNRLRGLSKLRITDKGMKNTFIGRTCSIMAMGNKKGQVDRLIFCYRLVNLTHLGYNYFYPWLPLIEFDMTGEKLKKLGAWIREDHREIPHARLQWERGQDFYFNTYKEFLKRESLFGIYKYHMSMLMNKIVLSYNTETNKYIIYFSNDNHLQALYMELDEKNFKLLEKIKRYMLLQEIDINNFIGRDDKENVIAYHIACGDNLYHIKEASKRRMNEIRKALL